MPNFKWYLAALPFLPLKITGKQFLAHTHKIELFRFSGTASFDLKFLTMVAYRLILHQTVFPCSPFSHLFFPPNPHSFDFFAILAPRLFFRRPITFFVKKSVDLPPLCVFYSFQLLLFMFCKQYI